jgi:hypothetical protein
VGGGHQIDVFRTLGDERFKNGTKLLGIRGCSHRAAADGGILTVFAFQSAATEKYGTAAAIACQNRLFPFVEHGFGHQSRIAAAAEAHFSRSTVHTALPGTENAVDIIHKIHILWGYDSSFFFVSQALLYLGEKLCYDKLL